MSVEGLSRLNDSIQTNKQKRKKTREDYSFIAGPNGKEELGKGSYGCVKLAMDKSTGQHVAIKIVTIILQFKFIDSFLYFRWEKNRFSNIQIKKI